MAVVIQATNGREIRVPVGVLIFNLNGASDIYCHPLRSLFTVQMKQMRYMWESLMWLVKYHTVFLFLIITRKKDKHKHDDMMTRSLFASVFVVILHILMASLAVVSITHFSPATSRIYCRLYILVIEDQRKPISPFRKL